MRRPVTLVALTLAALAAPAFAQPVVNVFAESRGGVVTASDMLGGAENVNDGSLVEGSGSAQGANNGAGSLSSVDIRTPTLSTAMSLRFRGSNDGGALSFRRSISHIELRADTNDDGIYETSAFGRAININYSTVPGNAATGNNLDLTIPFTPVAARNWRVIFTQGVSASFAGPRIQEVELNASQALPSSEDRLYELADLGTGARLLASSQVTNGVAENGFDGLTTIVRLGGTVEGSPGTIDFETAAPATTSAFRYRGAISLGTNNFNVTHIFLFADTDDNGSFETVVVNQPVNASNPLASINRITDGSGELDALFTFKTLTSRRWRLAVAAVGFSGSQTREVDLFGTLPAPTETCAADFNSDGSVGDIFDLFDFLAALDAGCP